jgi:diguanylate cyclase (GGDEF)-like protein
MKFLLIPLFLSVMMGLENLSGSGILFFITSDNTYKRGTMTILIYLFLFLYILYTIFLVEKSRRKGVNVRFFPVYHFVIPCLAGIFVQAMAYGITLGWTGVALGLMFVYVQEQSRNTYMDSLSGLYNRRYMEYVLKKVRLDDKAKLFGIMMDVNNFKQINDVFGHLKGDHAICSIGKILSKTVPSDGIAVRYAGDEFVVLLQTDSETKVNTFIRVLEENIDEFNSKKKEPYTLSLAMGYTQFDDSAGGINQFLSDMDAKMYAAKELHYRQKGADRRRKRD